MLKFLNFAPKGVAKNGDTRLKVYFGIERTPLFKKEHGAHENERKSRNQFGMVTWNRVKCLGPMAIVLNRSRGRRCRRRRSRCRYVCRRIIVRGGLRLFLPSALPAARAS